MKKILIIGLLVALPGLAYDFKANQWLFRGVIGESLYFAQDPTTELLFRNMTTGLEVNYMLTKRFALTTEFKPTFAVRNVILGFGVGAKQRCVYKDMPLIPTFALSLNPSVLIPTDSRKAHFNLGLRLSSGFEYFVARDLALGAEVGMTPSLLFGKLTTDTFEAAFDILIGATWRL